MERGPLYEQSPPAAVPACRGSERLHRASVRGSWSQRTRLHTAGRLPRWLGHPPLVFARLALFEIKEIFYCPMATKTLLETARGHGRQHTSVFNYSTEFGWLPSSALISIHPDVMPSWILAFTQPHSVKPSEMRADVRGYVPVRPEHRTSNNYDDGQNDWPKQGHPTAYVAFLDMSSGRHRGVVGNTSVVSSDTDRDKHCRRCFAG
jgi:hypothetical protein